MAEENEVESSAYYICAGIEQKYAVYDPLTDARVLEFDDSDDAILFMKKLNNLRVARRAPKLKLSKKDKAFLAALRIAV